MESNKEEALRCIHIARAALASGDKPRALKFFRIARRLNPSVSIDGSFSSCEKPDGSAPSPPLGRSAAGKLQEESRYSKSSEPSNGDRCYPEEHLKSIREIKSRKDYYDVLGVDKSCLVEDIRRAYKKLSLKVHPDKNKAPGADEAFKIVSKAFKCLSNEESRLQYDQIGLVEEFEFNHQSEMRRRGRRRARYGYFEDDLNPDEIFKSFFFGSQGNAYQVPRAHRPSRNASQQGERDFHVGRGLNFIAMLYFILVLVFLILICYPFPEPDYSLQKTPTYQVLKVTENKGIEYFVKTSEFDHQFPQGSAELSKVENSVLQDYMSLLNRYCRMERQRQHWVRGYPTPHCDKITEYSVIV